MAPAQPERVLPKGGLVGRSRVAAAIGGWTFFRGPSRSPNLLARPAETVRNVYIRRDVVLVWPTEHLASDPRRPADEVEQSAIDEAALWLRAQSKGRTAA